MPHLTFNYMENDMKNSDKEIFIDDDGKIKDQYRWYFSGVDVEELKDETGKIMYDRLLFTALSAIIKQKPDLLLWARDKVFDLHSRNKLNRLNVLRFICSSLDYENRTIVAKALGVSFEDLEATARVLRNI